MKKGYWPSNSDRAATVGYLATGIVAVTLFYWLMHDEYLRGVDAYYYALQADYWVKTGKVRIPDSSIVHRIIGILQWAGQWFEVKTETVIRLWESVTVAATVAGVSYFASKFRKSAAMWMLLAWAVLSPSLLFVGLEFPKMFLFAMSLWLWPLAIVGGRLRLTRLFAVAAFSLALHKGALAYLAVFGVVWALFYARRITNRVRAGAGVVLGLCVFVIFYRIFLVDHVSWLDLGRLKGVSFIPGCLSLLFRENLPVAVGIEIGLSIVSLVMLGMKLRELPKDQWLLPLTLVIPSFFPGGGLEVFNFGERFGILLPLAVAISWCVVLVWSASPREPQQGLKLRASYVFAAGVILVAALGTPLRLSLAHPKSLDPPFDVYSRITDAIREKRIPMLIAHQGLNFYYKFKTFQESFSYEPEEHWNKARIWRVVYGASEEEISFYTPPRCDWVSGLVARTPDVNYFLMREDCFEDFRSAIKSDNDPALFDVVWDTKFNPSQKRPAFLYRKHENDDPDEFPALAPAPNSSGK